MLERLCNLGIDADVARLVKSLDWAWLGHTSADPQDGFISIEGHVGASPWDVAVLLQAVSHKQDLSNKRVLDVGTGAGGLCAALVASGAKVTSIDIVQPRQIPGANCVQGDGLQGHHPGAPYDVIVAGGAVKHVPEAWFSQAPEGIIVAPVGRARQELIRFERAWGSVQRVNLGRVGFLPLDKP